MCAAAAAAAAETLGQELICSSSKITTPGEARQGMSEGMWQGKARQSTAKPISSEW
jgi:hypothetical protein